MNSFLFISNIIPGDDIRPEINLQKATYLAQIGIIDALSHQTENLTVIAYPQYLSYSQSHIFWRKGFNRKENNYRIVQISTLNMPFLRIIIRNALFLINIIKWCWENKGIDKHIIQYNVSSPSLFVTLVGHLFKKTDISAFLYDLGMPPSSYKMSKLRKFSYRLIDWQAKLLIDKLDYTFVINNNISKDYAPHTQSLLIDGGLSSDVLSNLPLKDNRDRNKIVLLIAGNLTETNGIRLLLGTVPYVDQQNVEFWFAGKGDLVDEIKSCSIRDNRIVYKGFFSSTKEMFELYSQCDILLNLRVMPKDEGKYLFPSKLLEYLATGRRVITTNILHVTEVYGDYCDILQNNDEKSLSHLIMKIIIEPMRETKGSNAQKYMLESHTWEMQVKRILVTLTDKNR